MKGARLVKEDAASVAAPAAPVAAGNRISVETAMAVAAFIDTRQGKATPTYSTPAIRSNTAPSAICDQTKAARVRATFIWTAPRLRTVQV